MPMYKQKHWMAVIMSLLVLSKAYSTLIEPSKRREHDLAASGDSDSQFRQMPHYTQEELNEILRKIFAQSTFWQEGRLYKLYLEI